MNTRKVGATYEKFGAEYLKDKGYRIIELNFFCRVGEIDIIALKDNYICFVEVKYRKNIKAGYPEEAVSYSKMKKICKASQFYLYCHKQYNRLQPRFDVMAIEGDVVRYYENAFPYV